MNQARPAAAIGQDTVVVSCRVLEPELTALGLGPDRAVYLDQGLHRYPDDLRLELGRELAKLEDRPEVGRVILGYGYCGGGLEGLSSRRLPLVLPLVHDCIPLLLGQASARPLVEEGSTFYLSPGWIDHGKTPLTEYFPTAEKFGHEEAQWVASEMLKGYRRVTLIRTCAALTEAHRLYACQMAALFGLVCEEVEGASGRLEALLQARTGPDLAVLPPGQTVTLGMYPQAGQAPEPA